MGIWYNLQPFDIVCGHLVCFFRFGMFGPKKSGNPASTPLPHAECFFLVTWDFPEWMARFQSTAPEKVARNQSPERQKCIQWLRNEAWGS
jgi:hypothetical protein